jgi:hypothetical protein
MSNESHELLNALRADGRPAQETRLLLDGDIGSGKPT